MLVVDVERDVGRLFGDDDGSACFVTPCCGSLLDDVAIRRLFEIDLDADFASWPSWGCAACFEAWVKRFFSDRAHRKTELSLFLVQVRMLTIPWRDDPTVVGFGVSTAWRLGPLVSFTRTGFSPSSKVSASRPVLVLWREKVVEESPFVTSTIQCAGNRQFLSHAVLTPDDPAEPMRLSVGNFHVALPPRARGLGNGPVIARDTTVRCAMHLCVHFDGPISFHNVSRASVRICEVMADPACFLSDPGNAWLATSEEDVVVQFRDGRAQKSRGGWSGSCVE